MSSVISEAQFEALKARAKRLRRQRVDLTQAQALDLVAEERGFSNWSVLARHRRTAQAVLTPVAPKKPYVVQLRAIVRSRDRSVRNIWWDEPVPANFPEAYYERFKWMPVHLQVADFEERVVRQKVAKVRRIIEFMDATALTPSNAWVRLWRRHPEHRPREMDHTAVWRDGKNRYVVTTEPYGGAHSIDPLRAWCEEHGWGVAVARRGRGMWYPCDASCPPDCDVHTQLVLMAPPKNGGDPQDIVSLLRS